MERPHRTTVTMDLKLSSMMTMSLLFFATSVPMIPMASPMSASFSARESFVPSPVTATTSPSCRSMCTRSYLSLGDDRAMTWSLSSLGPNRAMRCDWVMARNSAPSTARPPSTRMPHSRAMALAVLMLSPVTMRT